MTGAERLIGRERETGELERLLLDPSCPLVTIAGIGGVGKTSLAEELQERLGGHFPDGTHMVPLSNLEHSGQLLPAMLSAVGRSSMGTRDLSMLCDVLSRRKKLLILDNFEHLITASPVIKALTKGQNNSKLLITSRTLLDIPGECVYRLSGIELPGPVPSRKAHSVQLFLRSGDIQEPVSNEDLALVSSICNALAGVPLAIKLAAALTAAGSTLREIERAVRTGEYLLDIKDDGNERRHSSLRRVFSCSWTLLTKVEQQMFASLSVFRGAFSAKAAAEVTGAQGSTLDSLHRKSLLNFTPDNSFLLHPLLRQFSANMLIDHFKSSEALKTRHAEYYCNLISIQKDSLHSSRSHAAMKIISQCYPDIMAAADFAIQHKMTHLLAKASGGLRQMLTRFGYLEAGENLFKRIVSVLDAEGEEEPAYTARVELGIFLLEKAEYDGAVVYFEQALATHDPAVHSRALYCLGMIYMRTGNFTRAEHYLTRSLEQARQNGVTSVEASGLSGLGDLYNHLYDVEKSRYYMEQAVELNRSLGDIRGLCSNLITLSNLMDNNGNGEEALEFASESLEHAHTLRGDLFTGLAEASMASALETLGRLEEALDYAARAVRRYEKNDLKWGMQTSYSTLASIQSKLGMRSDSLDTADKLVKVCIEIGATYNSMEYFMVAGSVFDNAGEKEQALSVYRRAEKIARHLKIDKHIQDIQNRIASLL